MVLAQPLGQLEAEVSASTRPRGEPRTLRPRATPQVRTGSSCLVCPAPAPAPPRRETPPLADIAPIPESRGGHGGAAGIWDPPREEQDPRASRGPRDTGRRPPFPPPATRCGPGLGLVPPGGTAAPRGSGSADNCPRGHTSRAHPTRHRASRWDKAWTWGRGRGDVGVLKGGAHGPRGRTSG